MMVLVLVIDQLSLVLLVEQQFVLVLPFEQMEHFLLLVVEFVVERWVVEGSVVAGGASGCRTGDVRGV